VRNRFEPAVAARGRESLGNPKSVTTAVPPDKSTLPGFDVAMHDAVFVRIGQGARNIAQEVHGVPDGHDGHRARAGRGVSVPRRTGIV
jgi:hypothetical protein